jgi:tRNA-dihydrouridine synthase
VALRGPGVVHAEIIVSACNDFGAETIARRVREHGLTRVVLASCETDEVTPLIREHFGEKYALVQMKKHLAWYTEGLGHATECRARIFQTREPDEVWDLFQSYWDRPRPEISQTASTWSPRIA